MNYEQLTQKKRELDKYRPLPSALVKNLEEWFRVELTYTSNALEGNTLTRRETALVVEKGLTVGGKSLVEHLEATNHAQAIDWILLQVKRKPNQIEIKDILQLHSIILQGIDNANAGHFRRVAVRISGSTVVLPNPLKVPELMAAFCAWLKSAKGLHPVELAAQAHYRLVTIHPFVDGNGRTARLLMNLLLLMQGYPMAIIRKRDRLAYIGALEKAQLGGSISDYNRLINVAVDRSLNIYIKSLKEEPETVSVEPGLMLISELASKAGETKATIRYWTQLGLLSVAEITPAGYQLYASEMVERIQKIRALKAKRLTLNEIKAELK